MLAACDESWPWGDVADGFQVEVVTAFVPVDLPGVEGVVMSGPTLPADCLESSGAVDAWRPATRDMAALEAGLPAFVRDNAHVEMPDQWRRLDDYRRQYLGRCRNGRRILHVELFPADFSGWPDWRTTQILVSDGGPRHFRVDYDVEAGRFTLINFNGWA
jgi:hypothetical protein